MTSLLSSYTSQLATYFEGLGIGHGLSLWMVELTLVLILFVLAYFIFILTSYVMNAVMVPMVKKTETKYDDFLITHRFFRKLSFFVPSLFLYYITNDVLTVPALVSFLRAAIEVIFILNAVVIVSTLVSVLSDIYHAQEFSKDKPLFAIFQVARIAIYLVGFLFVIALFLERDISNLVLSLGAASAILLLIFKDSILGLASGLNLIFNKMVSIGDWIEMTKYGADGEVLEVNLTNVKVRNWDKTITTIPTYAMTSDSFKNWRGMEESGGRRIKRSIFLDMESVHFCDAEMLAKMNRIKVLRPYLDQKSAELAAYNERMQVEPDAPINGRRQTNLGIFRAYLSAYLKNRTDINQEMTFLVRQLQPTEKGLPLEIYVFTTTTSWAPYEGIQADIFDHMIAALPEFGLRIFQLPTNHGFKKLALK